MPVKHAVEQGESLALLAEKYGHSAEKIWGHAENATLRRGRRNGNALLPGDILFIPDKDDLSHSCQMDFRHRFLLKGVPMLFRMQLLTEEGPRANRPYVLTVDGQELRGTTDADGGIARYIPNASRTGQLNVGDGEFQATVQFGHMDAIESESGWEKRLRNMGFGSIAAFQQFLGLTVTGEMDESTRSEIEKCHDDPRELWKRNEAALERMRTDARKWVAE